MNIALFLLLLNPPDHKTEFVGLILDSKGNQVHVEVEVYTCSFFNETFHSLQVKVDRQDSPDFRVQWNQWEFSANDVKEVNTDGYGWDTEDDWLELYHDGEVIYRMYLPYPR